MSPQGIRLDEPRPFGEVAIELGLVTEAEIRQAIEYQETKGMAGDQHKLIAVALVEFAILTQEQVIDVLKAQESGLPLTRRTTGWTGRFRQWLKGES